MLLTKGQIHNSELPVKYHTESTKSTVFIKYAYHPNAQHGIKV